MSRKSSTTSDNGTATVEKQKRVRKNTVANTVHIYALLTTPNQYLVFSKLDGKVLNMVKFDGTTNTVSNEPVEPDSWLWKVAPRINGADGMAASLYTVDNKLVISGVEFLKPVVALVEMYTSAKIAEMQDKADAIGEQI